jgi:cobyrinic acid a,c-diamide synthase
MYSSNVHEMDMRLPSGYKIQLVNDLKQNKKKRSNKLSYSNDRKKRKTDYEETLSINSQETLEYDRSRNKYSEKSKREKKPVDRSFDFHYNDNKKKKQNISLNNTNDIFKRCHKLIKRMIDEPYANNFIKIDNE